MKRLKLNKPKLDAWIKKEKTSEAQLAIDINYHQSTFSNYTNHPERASLKFLEALANFTGLGLSIMVFE